MHPDAQPVRDLHARWIQAVNAGQLEALLEMMTEDATFLAPGREPLGRAGFAASFAEAQGQLRVHCVSELEEVVLVGEVAYTRSRDALSVTPLAGGEATGLAGFRVTIYRRQAEGRWLLARDAHTLTPGSPQEP